MCGITGVFKFNGKVDIESFNEINNTIEHRGPDNGSVKVFDNVGLGHRRLSIIDLTKSADQPMNCDRERYTIVFNGEVYNFKELKNRLKSEGVSFKTNSDTEVVLKAYIHFGEDAFSMFNGIIVET